MESPIAVFISSTVFGIMAFFFIKSSADNNYSLSGCLSALVGCLIIPSLVLSVASTVLCIREYGFAAHPLINLYGILISAGGVIGYIVFVVLLRIEEHRLWKYHPEEAERRYDEMERHLPF